MCENFKGELSPKNIYLFPSCQYPKTYINKGAQIKVESASEFILPSYSGGYLNQYANCNLSTIYIFIIPKNTIGNKTGIEDPYMKLTNT